MRLIGMLDSPFVRRVAISLDVLGLSFEHESLSVFSTFEQFRDINPVVKAPTLVCDDGTVLMESSLILQFLEAHTGQSLWSGDRALLGHEVRAVGLALAASEKSVQILYEQNIRPTNARHAPWLERVTSQLLAAYEGLEREVATYPSLFVNPERQCSITAAVAWQFTQFFHATLVPSAQYPALAALSARMENTAPFLQYPCDGPGVPRQ